MIDRVRQLARRARESGVRLRVVNNTMIIVAVIVSALLLLASMRTTEGYRELQNTTERHITCQKDARLFQEGSDYLTSESRYFALTGLPEHVQNYIREVELTRRRDKVFDDIEIFSQRETSFNYLREAMDYSNELLELECYAMRLAAEGWACDMEQIPARIRDVELEGPDQTLSAEAQRAEATRLLFGEEYQEKKAKLTNNVVKSINILIDDAREMQDSNAQQLDRLLLRQHILTALLLLLVLAVVLFTAVLVIRPLDRCVAKIGHHQQIPVTGSYEMRFLARTYNEIFEKNAEDTEKLTYSATHDALTGLYNRAAFDSKYAEINHGEVGLLIIDVDKFKQINDSYGHDVGDRVLKRVADVVQDSFRSDDFVSRIGGDEFSVIMMRVNSQLRGLVETKIRRANDRLTQSEDGLPSISISVGVAFGDRKNPRGDLFKDADTALYSVKHAGGRGCSIYG